MNANRKQWNQQQQTLQAALKHPEDFLKAKELFMCQHAMVHATAMSQSELWSFEDEVLQNMTEADFRHIPQNEEHSIAWILWHIARIEDVTMNLLIAGTPQLFQQDHWQERLKTTIGHTGNAMSVEAIAELSAALDIEVLREYRIAVGRRTQQIVKQLEPMALKYNVNPARLQQVRKQGAVVEAADEIVAYWGSRTYAGLLLMPATRHNFLHLNEALRLKQKRR
jgi:hypothetical protein